MPGSFEGILIIVADFALAGVAMWAILTLRKASVPKRFKALAAASLFAVVFFIVLCLLLMPEVLVALIGMGAMLAVYYALLQRSNKMGK